MRQLTLKQQQFQFLRKLYKLADGIAYKDVNMIEIGSALNISNEKIMAIIVQLKNKNLAQFTFQFASITPDGIEEVENEMEKTYAEKEYLVLKTIHEMSQNSPTKSIDFDDVIKEVGMSSNEFIEIITELYDNKRYLGESIDGHLQLSPRGKEFLQGRSNYLNDNRVNNFNFHGDVVGFQNQTNNSTQNIQINVNPGFDKAIAGLLEVIKAASIDEDEKEALVNDVKVVNNLAQKGTPETAKKALSRLQLIDTSIKALDLTVKVAPYLPAIIAYFEGLLK